MGGYMDHMKKTPIHEEHLRHKGRMSDFFGWDLPLRYTGAREEHLIVRNQAGLFDVSHMGQISLLGPEAVAFCDYLVTGDVLNMSDGEALYTTMLNVDGGIVDDLIVYRRSGDSILLVVNAATIMGDFEHVQHHSTSFNLDVENKSDSYGQLALQGPKSKEILAKFSAELAESLVKPFKFVEGEYHGVELLVSTTGYTGEWGYELYCPWDQTELVWKQLLELGKEEGLAPIGLSARDTLRLEATLSLYGSDISTETDPFEAGLGWTVNMDRDFVGREALIAKGALEPSRKLVGFKMLDGGMPRKGCEILVDDQPVGFVTSGNRAPTSGRIIGLGYVDLPYNKRKTELQIDIRGKKKSARVIRTPFYRRKD